MERISPELALVDERLDSTARSSLPDAADCLVPAAGQPVQARPSVQPASRKRELAPLALLPIALLGLAFVIASLPLSSSRGDGKVEGARAASTSTPAAESKAEPTSQTVAVGQVRWKRVPSADFYNVIFWRNGTRALDLWPTTPSAKVPLGDLKPGVYQWFVYPAFEKGGTRHYGRVIAQGRLKV